jgi:hypothetical protein
MAGADKHDNVVKKQDSTVQVTPWLRSSNWSMLQ